MAAPSLNVLHRIVPHPVELLRPVQTADGPFQNEVFLTVPALPDPVESARSARNPAPAQCAAWLASSG
jgi:hypothetical protein